MKTIVLAAGTGSRLGQLTSVRTKGMVPVKGRRLIDYLLDFIDPDVMDEIIVVGGFCYEDLRDHLALRKQKNLRVIENREFLKGNIFTLVAALEEFEKDSFLITNVDHIYPGIMFDRMKQSFQGITAMTDRDRQLGQDDMKVRLAADGKIVKSANSWMFLTADISA
jgi:choline kinase